MTDGWHTMADYVSKEQIINWFRPYGKCDDPIPFETLVSDLRDMKAADVAQVVHAHWIFNRGRCSCSHCGGITECPLYYCPQCGAKVDGQGVRYDD